MSDERVHEILSLHLLSPYTYTSRITSPLPQAVACYRDRGMYSRSSCAPLSTSVFRFPVACCFLPFRNFLPHRFPLQYYTTILTPINPLPPPRFRYLAPLPLLNPRKLIISLTHPQNPQQSTQPPFPTLLIHPPSLSTGDNHITGTVAS
jgi:hypothetical protein